MRAADVVIVGAGAAGLSLAHWLHSPAAGTRPPDVVLVDAPPGPLRPPERTWCFWEGPGGPHDAAVRACWRQLRVRAPGGAATTVRPEPLRYKMIRSADFAAAVLGRLGGSPCFRRLQATVTGVRDLADGAEVRGLLPGGDCFTLRARWVYDSRPLAAPPPARTALAQHFRGWFVRTRDPVFDPHVADLMDFRTPQPAGGLSFGYVLPTSAHEALVEYTEFSPAPLDRDAYEAALRHYAEAVLRLGPYRVTGAEQGLIPMTDGRYRPRAGRSVFSIGTRGGATRAATGYTFAAVQRQSRAVAAAFRDGRTPAPPPAYGRRARALDAVMLRALATGRLDGPAFFSRLFARVPAERLLRFLDGGTRLWEDLAVGRCVPARPMLRSAAELPWLPRRAALPGAVPGPAARTGAA
ncbi:lycopene cyclase family protein [Streptomyces sp. 7-21]|uniref:lycopene cyclase family protein n=1 Tax=Streptomyces sp. 7-21 TaxID=2802283 RepID=UPI00191CAF43|nr:lycopene cyclase family protein [Streptomyces sp. 7-21]MBL1065842.1 lycopene cyclase [Streptomyces sp. 7-21]